VCARAHHGEKVYAYETERVQSVIYPHIRLLSELYIYTCVCSVVDSSANWRNWWNKGCFDVSLCIQIKKQISIRGRRHYGYNFCEILDPAAVQDCRKSPSEKNILLQLVSHIINGVCYKRYEKHLEQQKYCPNVNICTAEDNFKEEL